MTIKVIGAGFGRTGTSSMQAALEQLGFGKCYHMREIFMSHPQHAALWTSAARGGAPDWDALFAGYQSTVDWPGCTFYRALIERYPDAKVVLNVRDPERWYASALNTIYPSRNAFPMNLLRKVAPRAGHMATMLDALIWEGTFHGRFSDKQYAIEVFNRHNQEVQRVVPSEKLLVYDVKQGWEPLCRFLDVPVPTDTPFPRLNDTAQFQQMFKRRARLMQAGLAALVLGGLVGGRLIWQRSAR